MKKVVFVILIMLLTVVSAINTYAGNSLKLFYNENFFDLSQEIIVRGNEFFINAEELTAVIGTACKIDPSNTALTLENNNLVKNFEIKKYDYSLIEPTSITHNLPELICDKVYFPFSFITKEYNVNIKYDQKANILYFFPENGKLDTFTNKKCNYTLNIPDNLYFNLDDSYDNFDASSVSVINNDNTFSASIICDVVNKSSLENMRFLLSDYTSSDSEMFDSIVEYKQSYFRSLLDSYKNEFLFGNLDSTLSESNIKIIKQYTENLFGQDSNIILFNTITSSKFSSIEDVNIIITIPAYINKSIYSLTFTMEKGALNDSNINNILQLIKGLSITNLPTQQSVPEVLHDNTAISAANSGIYPSLSASEIKYTVLEDPLNLYKIKYPSNFVPYLQNNFIDNNSYRSFKIDHNNFISISVEHSPANPNRILKKINALKSYYNDKIKVNNINNQNINGKEFIVLNYETDNNNRKEYITDYFIANGLRFYTIELNSLIQKPSESISNEFLKIVSSFEFTTQENSNNTNSNISFVKFSNDRKGYSIFYPDDWSIQDNSQDINYDSFEITNPNFSGPLDIVINESEYTSNLTAAELLRYTTGYDSSSLDKYFKNYIAPYTGKTFKVLKSSIDAYNDFTMIYKLVNYLDEGDRYKMCYSIDIVRDNKINSLYISASEYLFQDGVLADRDLNYILDFMSKSFCIEDTKEYNKSLHSSDKRNNKIIFIENFFKDALGKSTVVTFAKNLTSEKDVLIYINNSDEAGAYRLVFDYTNKKIEVASRVLNPEIAKSAEEKLRNIFKGKYIQDISVNFNDMTISIKYSDTLISEPTTKVYYLQVTPSKKDFSIDFVRKFNTESIKEECQNFLENYLLNDVQVYFPKSFNYLNENWNKYYYEKILIPIYAESDGQSGYFYLEVDPVTDCTRILKYISTNDLIQKIEDYYFMTDSDPDIEVLDYSTQSGDKFCFNVSTSSKTGKRSNQTIYISFDEKNQDLTCSPQDLYFSGILIE